MKLLNHTANHDIGFICSYLKTNQEYNEEAAYNFNLNWDSILKRARQENITPLFYRKLMYTRNNQLDIPAGVIDALKEDYYSTVAHSMLLLKELNKVLNNFKSDKIDILVLKGAALLENIYQDIGLRKMTDIDILIRKEAFPEIDKTLKQLGYLSDYNWADYMDMSNSQYLNSIYYIKEEGALSIFLHLHWHIINTVVPAYAYGNIDIDRFWREARQVNIAGVKTLIMAPHHLLIHLCEHLLKHSYSPFILFCDISEVINKYEKDGLDWESVVSEAVRFNLNRPVYHGLYFSSKFLGAKIPDGILARLKPQHINYGERKIQTLIENKGSIPELQYFSYFVMNDSLKKKLKFILRSIFPSRNVLALQHKISPQEIKFNHYIIKIKTAFVKGSRLLIYLWRQSI